MLKGQGSCSGHDLRQVQGQEHPLSKLCKQRTPLIVNIVYHQ